MLSDLKLRLIALLRRDRTERAIDEELRFHIENAVDRYVASGLDRQEAERRVRLEFGGLDQVKEEYRDALGVRWVLDLARDVRYAFRTLRRSSIFAATAIVSVAVGVGANTLVFSVVNALVLKPLPIADPERVVFVQRSGSFVSHSFPVYRELRDWNTTFTALAGYRVTMMQVEAAGRATQEWGYLATGNYFELLGLHPAAGRFFGPADDLAPGASPYAVLSYDYWQSRFGGYPAVIGSTIQINRLPFTVLGVAPPGFFGTEIFYRPRIWVPMMMQAQIEVGNPWLDNPNTSNTWVVGRLRPGVSADAAASNLNAVLRQIGARETPPIRLTRPGLIGDELGAPARAFAMGVLVLAGLVLATACANLSSSLAARGTDRQRELAIRLSIGAGRGRIVRQLLTESVVIATAGGAVGALGAWMAARALSAWQLPTAVPLQLDVTPDLRVLAFTFVITLIAGIAFGLAPARQAARISPVTVLKSLDGAGHRRWPIRDVLVGLQVALCFVLVAACLVSLEGLRSTMSMPIGMQPEGVTMVSFNLGLAGYSENAGEELRRRALERIAALPGIESAAYGNSLPLNIDQSTGAVSPDDRSNLSPTDLFRVVRYQVSPGFFRTLGIGLLRGRDFEWRDSRTGRRVAIINEAFARQVLRTDAPIGRRFRYGTEGTLIEIVGLVKTGKYRSLTEVEAPAVFEPMLQAYNTTTVMLVRSARPSSAVAADVSSVLASLDPSLAVFNVRSVESMLGFVLLPMRVAAIALGAFGVLAMTLAATGIYGIVAYAVAQRRREIAIRVAVGAPWGSIVRMVLRRIAIMVLLGVAIGVVLAVAAQGLLRTIVYQASTTNPVTLAGVTMILAAVGFAACWSPVRAALKVDPVRALHVE